MKNSMFANLRDPVRWLRALLWSTGLTVLALGVEYWRNPCSFYLSSLESVVLQFGFLYLWILVFGVLGSTGRLTLVVISMAAALALPNILRNRVAAVQSRTIAALRIERNRLEEYRDKDSRKSYPSAVPKLASDFPIHKYYRFTYVGKTSVAGGPIDSYEITAIGIRPECGFARNFTLISDGTIHHTMEPRAATSKDPPI